MKRGTFGILLLILLFFAGLSSMRSVREEIRPIAGNMELAAQAALREDYGQTAALTEKARTAWNENHLKFSLLSDQATVRTIDSLYDEVEVFLKAEEKVHCSAACQALKNQLQALMEEQNLSLPILL